MRSRSVPWLLASALVVAGVVLEGPASAQRRDYSRSGYYDYDRDHCNDRGRGSYRGGYYGRDRRWSGFRDVRYYNDYGRGCYQDQRRYRHHDDDDDDC